MTVRGPPGPPGQAGIVDRGSVGGGGGNYFGGGGGSCGCNQTLLSQYVRDIRPKLIPGPPGPPGSPGPLVSCLTNEKGVSVWIFDQRLTGPSTNGVTGTTRTKGHQRRHG